MEYADSSPHFIFQSCLILILRWEYKRHASWVRLQPPCWPVYSTHGSVDRLLRQLGWHSRAFPTVTVRLHRDVGMCVCGEVGLVLLASNPLLSSLGLAACFPLQAPSSWLDSFAAKTNLKDSLGTTSGYRKQGQWKWQTTTQMYTGYISDWAVTHAQHQPQTKDLH